MIRPYSAAAKMSSSSSPQSSSAAPPSPTPSGADVGVAHTARMNPESRLILVVIGSVIAAVLVAGGIISLIQRTRYVQCFWEDCVAHNRSGRLKVTTRLGLKCINGVEPRSDGAPGYWLR